MTDRLRSALVRPALLLDAAMGTRLIARGLKIETDDPAFWNLSHPEEVAAVHESDIAAGADALLTNTFGANRPWLSRFHRADQLVAINRHAVALARRSAGAERLVIGSIGPAAFGYVGAYREQAEVLSEAGVDALLFETHRFDQAEAALRAVGTGIRPLLVSLVAWPEPCAEAVARITELGVSALGGNCQPGMAGALGLATVLRRETSLPLIVKPSAGLPGTATESPESFAGAVPALLALGPVLIGGCCGTTDSHVAALRAACYHAMQGPRKL